MSGETQSAAQRRKSLVEASERNRAALEQSAGTLVRKLALAEAVVAAVSGLSRHRVLIGAAALGLLFWPRGGRSGFGRVLAMAPLFLEAYRLARSPGGTHQSSEG